MVMQLLKILRTDIPQIDTFGVAPYAFVGIEIRSIRWQRLQMNVFRCAILQKLAHAVASMNGRSVPHHQQLAVNVAMNVRQKINGGRAVQGIDVDRRKQSTGGRDATHDGQMVSGVKDFQHGRMSLWCVSACHKW